MVSPISAAFISGITSDVTCEKGVVSARLDETTYVITLQSGELTVKVPGGSLYPGEAVTINSHGDTITIEQVPPEGAARASLDDTAELQQGRYFTELLSLLRQAGNASALTSKETDMAAVLAEIVKVVEGGEWNASSVARGVALLKTALAAQGPMPQTGPDSVVTGRIHELIELLSTGRSPFEKTPGELPAANQTIVISLDTSPAPGFYFVKNCRDAKQLLQPYMSPGGTVNTLLKTTDDAPRIIRFFPSGQGGMKAALMPPEQAVLEIEHMLRFEMKSAVLQRLDPGIVADAIAQKGHCGMEVLQKLDELLSSIPTGKADSGRLPALPEPALMLTLSQVVALVLDTGNVSMPDMQSVLARTTPQLLELVSKVTELLEMTAPTRDLSEIKKVISESMVPGAIVSERKNDLIPLLIKSMGYSLEHDLTTNALQSGASSLMNNFPSLKLALLYMLALCDTVVETEKSFSEVTGRNDDGRTAVLRLPVGEGGEKNALRQPEDNNAGRESTILSQPSLEGVRQQIEQALNRLESLQMLARQTTNSQGEQQVIVVPIHVGDEYTELRLAFNKDKKKGRKNKPSEHIKVHITMDLTALGAIDAIMNYRLNKELSVSLTLDNIIARSWFQRNVKGAIEALQGLGFPSVSISVSDTNAAQIQKRHFFQKSGDVPSLFDTKA